MKIFGEISTDKFASGSKSEHEAVYLKTNQGIFVLRKKNENPFEQSSLRNLEGKKVIAHGSLDDYLFIADEVIEINT